jgi:hypothetical protein|tara:strand:+ start:259 stop:603 length:345 start_codon:yes stop_codon:yes gene_type:complete
MHYFGNKECDKAEKTFAASFQKNDPAIDKKFEDLIKCKIVETRNWLKILRDYRKEKTVIYWKKINPDSVESFEMYYIWSDRIPLDSYEEIRKTAYKNPVSYLYIWKSKLWETIK